jgi:hypothetical protein
VHPQAWSAGEGQQRPDGALAALTAEGSTVVTLWVLTSNDRAPRFYSRHRHWQLDGPHGCRVGRCNALKGALQANTGTRVTALGSVGVRSVAGCLTGPERTHRKHERMPNGIRRLTRRCTNSD